MIITDPEHWLKWRDYHGIIAQRTPYKSHNAKRTWFVLVFDVIMQWVYWQVLLIHCFTAHLDVLVGNSA